jgi:hypothetical protein
MPKMSIGGEFGWGLGYVRNGKTTKVWESEGMLSDGSEAAAELIETFKADRLFGINEQSVIIPNSLINYLQPNGLLRLNFYF